MVEKKVQKSGLAITSLVLGIISFFPLLGFFIGIAGIIFGIIALVKIKNNGLGGKGLAITGIILSVLGICGTLLIYGTLFYMLFNPTSSLGQTFLDDRIELSKTILSQDAGAIELYKKNKGQYPENLDSFANSTTFIPMDHFMNAVQYTISADKSSYELRTAGPDKQLNTEDDIVYP